MIKIRVHPDHRVHRATMAPMENMELMARKAKRVHLDRCLRGSMHKLSHHASYARPDPKDHRDRSANPARLARKEILAAKLQMVNQVQAVQPAHLVHPARLDLMANLERKAHLVTMPNKEEKVQLDPKAKKDHQDHQDLPEKKAQEAKLVHPDPAVHQVHQVKEANQATKDPPVHLVRKAHPVRMPITAHVRDARRKQLPKRSNKFKMVKTKEKEKIENRRADVFCNRREELVFAFKIFFGALAMLI